jgi:hypothetical protein
MMMAFTFLGAASRFNDKRMLIAEEANCIETAYLRLHFSQRGAAKGTTNGFLRRRSGLLLGKQLMEQENSSR